MDSGAEVLTDCAAYSLQQTSHCHDGREPGKRSLDKTAAVRRRHRRHRLRSIQNAHVFLYNGFLYQSGCPFKSTSGAGTDHWSSRHLRRPLFLWISLWQRGRALHVSSSWPKENVALFWSLFHYIILHSFYESLLAVSRTASARLLARLRIFYGRIWFGNLLDGSGWVVVSGDCPRDFYIRRGDCHSQYNQVSYVVHKKKLSKELATYISTWGF